MTNGTMLVTVLVIAPVGIATWILASHTVGESLDPRNATSIGFSIALLAIATAASLLVLSNATEKPGSRLGLILVICGTACILVALALQFYVTSVLAANSQRVADILRERGGNVNLNVNFESVKSISYFALLAGVWLAAVGIRIGVNREGLPKVGAATIVTAHPRSQGEATETGIREGSA
jgi:hypothetical protein